MTTPRTDPELLAVARGDQPADVLLRGGRIVDVFSRTVTRGDVAIHGDRIAVVFESPRVAATEVVSLDGAYVAPGFIDAHMHVESTMMVPASFASVVVPRGTTAVVLDPHEIANVLGLPGIRLLMDLAADLPLNAWFAAPSCVPASPLETSGAELSAEDLRPLLDDERVVALAEMMNFPGVIHATPEVLDKIRMGLRRGVVDGHGPGLLGAPLQAYVAAGISSDHECTTLEEARQRLALGMRVYLREGSASQNLEALLPLVNPGNAHRFCFCTDDRHPRDLVDEGHIDHVVRKAVVLGLDPVTAIAMATRHAAEHYGQPDHGAVAPGCFADLIVFDDLGDIRPRQVYFHGRRVAEAGRLLENLEAIAPERLESFCDTVKISAGLSEGALRMAAGAEDRQIRVIGLVPHQLYTEDLHVAPARVDGRYVADPSQDLLKLAVIERHRGTGNIGLGFVRGFGLKRGAIASTVSHDAHNLIVVGTNDADMLVAARALAACGGGQCVVDGGQVRALIALPIAGLLSASPVAELLKSQRALDAASRAIGCPLEDPFMPLSFLSLTVIPRLKLSDFGLIDVERFEVVPLLV